MPDGENINNQNPDGGGEQQQTQNQQATDVVSRDELLKVIKERDEAKKKIREREEADAKARGDFESLNAQLKADLEAKAKEIEELSIYRDRLTSFEQKRKESLLNQLSEEHKKIASKLDLETLEDYVTINAKQPPAASSSYKTGVGISDNITYSEFAKLDSKQKADFAVKFPQKFKEFLRY